MVSRRLTLNLGLRYEYNTPDVEKQNRLAHLNIETMEYELAAQNGASRALYKPDKNNFGPRFGFAFRPDATGQMVIRGGYGIVYDLAIIGSNLFFVRTGPPFQRPQSFDAGPRPADLTLSDPFPSLRLAASPIFDAPSPLCTSLAPGADNKDLPEIIAFIYATPPQNGQEVLLWSQRIMLSNSRSFL